MVSRREPFIAREQDIAARMNERAKAGSNDGRRIHLLDDDGSPDALTGCEAGSVIEVTGDGTIRLVEDNRASARGPCVLPRGELLGGAGLRGRDNRTQAEGYKLQRAGLAHEAVNLSMFLVEARADLLAQMSVLKVSEDGQLKILADITTVNGVGELQACDARAALPELFLGAPFELAKDPAHLGAELITRIGHQAAHAQIHGNILGQHAEGAENAGPGRNQDVRDAELRSNRGGVQRSSAAIGHERVIGG